MLTALKLMVPSIATFANEVDRLRGATATWKDATGFRTEYKVEFRFTKTSEQLAFQHGEYVNGVGYVYVDSNNIEHKLTQPRLEEILKQAVESNTLDAEMVAKIRRDTGAAQAKSTDDKAVDVEAEMVS
jgi:hypothetical protein